jgi:hypothetical protein
VFSDIGMTAACSRGKRAANENGLLFLRFGDDQCAQCSGPACVATRLPQLLRFQHLSVLVPEEDLLALWSLVHTPSVGFEGDQEI